MYLLKIFLLFSFLFSFVYASEDIEPKITSVNYSGNLSVDSLININGEGLDSCTDLSIDTIKLDMESKVANKIVFLYSGINKYSGTLTLKCGEKTLKRIYSFPYINKITGLSDDSKSKFITISGNNFGFTPDITLEGGNFIPNIKQNSLITGELSTKINGNNLFVTVGGLKSNIYSLGIKLPKINFIYSKDNFYKKTEIFIYGDNLNYYKKSQILFQDEIITDFIENKDGSLSFIPQKSYLGKKDIKVISNGFESNLLSVDINGDKPIINNVFVKRINDEINGTSISKEVISILGENFPGYIEDINVYQNAKKLTISKKTSKELFIDNYNLDEGNNFFRIDVNGDSSNVFNLYNKFDLPSITGFEILSVEDNKRSIKIFLSKFNKDDGDKIYLNGSTINPVGCMSNMCRIEISESVTKGTLGVGTSMTKNDLVKEFDISNKYKPFIESIRFRGGFEKGNKIEVSGNNFYNSIITSTNLFSKRDNGEDDINVGGLSIEGEVSRELNLNSNSTININNFGLSTSLTFNNQNLDGSKFYGVPIINELISDNNYGEVKAGDLVRLEGKGFRDGDIVNIGNTKILLDVKNINTSNLLIPYNLEEGKYNLFIENASGSKSNTIEIIVLNDYYTPNITISSSKIEKKSFYLGETNNENIYSLDFSNKLSDMIIKNISFNVNNYQEDNYLGTFKLKIGSKIVGTSLITKEGLITFNGNFLLEKSLNNTTISLIKDSVYITKNDFEISFNKSDFQIFDKNSNLEFNDINYETLNINKINLLIKNKTNCIDNSGDNLNCNNFLSKGVIKEKIEDSIESEEPKKTEEIKEIKQEDKNTNIEIDNATIKLKGIKKYKFKSKSYQKLNFMFTGLVKKLSKKSKYKNKILDIESKLNDIIKDLYSYEQSRKGSSKKKMYKTKLINDIKAYKQLLK